MRKSLWWVSCWCLLVAGVISSMSSIAAATTTSSSATKLMSLAIHDAEGSGWVHEISNTSEAGHKFSMVNDIGTSEGRQVINADGAHGQVLVLDGNAYLYGDDRAIADYFELPKSDPQKYANQWLELTPSNPGYSTVSAAVTLKSDFEHVSIPGRLKTGGITSIDGHKVRPISGHIPATSQTPAGNATLYVTTSGKILPVEFRETAKGITSTTNWTDWGHGVQLAVPSSTPLAP